MTKIKTNMSKIAAILLIAAVLLAVTPKVHGEACFFNLQAAPKNYTSKVQTGGELEAHYMAMGPYDVSSYEEPVLQGFGKYLLYYPSQLTETADAYPVIVISNGSGTPLSKYTAVAKHFASWGFLVIGTEEEYDWNGFSSEMCIRYLTLLNENQMIGDGRENIFYQKIDLNHVGIVGHSQGGVGVFNAITAQQHSSVFKTAVSISPTNKKLAHDLLWDYDAAQVNVPILLLSGAGGGDDWVVTGEQLKEIYDDVSSDKVMLRRKDTPHGLMLYSANGYVTAWFMWQLQGDAEAAKAFMGEDAEILRNPYYQDQQRSFHESRTAE